MKRDKREIIIWILVIVLLIALGILLYIFLIKPALSGMVTQGQNQGFQQGVQYTVYSIMQQTVSCNPQGVPLTFGNQTIHIIAIECLTQPQQQI